MRGCTRYTSATKSSRVKAARNATAVESSIPHSAGQLVDVRLNMSARAASAPVCCYSNLGHESGEGGKVQREGPDTLIPIGYSIPSDSVSQVWPKVGRGTEAPSVQSHSGPEYSALRLVRQAKVRARAGYPLRSNGVQAQAQHSGLVRQARCGAEVPRHPQPTIIAVRIQRCEVGEAGSQVRL
jgi:hypothetical protein